MHIFFQLFRKWDCWYWYDSKGRVCLSIKGKTQDLRGFFCFLFFLILVIVDLCELSVCPRSTFQNQPTLPYSYSISLIFVVNVVNGLKKMKRVFKKKIETSKRPEVRLFLFSYFFNGSNLICFHILFLNIGPK